MVRRSDLLPILLVISSISSGMAQTSPWAPIPQGAVFETGDSWIAEGVRFRLYGVQACIRGTSFTNASAQRRDCGEASLAMLASFNRDLQPVCAAVLAPTSNTLRYVTCLATPKQGQASGSRIDLGTALIASGFAFAALQADGKPVHMPYFVAQLDAKRAKAGLWAYADLPEPNAIILKALRAQPGASLPSGGAPR